MIDETRIAAKSFEDVDIWKNAHAWVLSIYKFSEGFPKHELFGLSSQLRLFQFQQTSQKDSRKLERLTN